MHPVAHRSTDGPGAAAAKAALRRARRTQRTGRATPGDSDDERDGDRLADLVLALPEAAAPGAVLAAYVSTATEPPTDRLLRRLRALARPALLPVLDDDLDLRWALDDGGRAPGRVRARLLEPGGTVLGPDAVAAASVVVVPALAVDRSGTRLGQGGGSYDRALARIAPGALVVALLHPGELVDQPLPREPHDRPVSVVVSTAGVVRLSAPAPAAGSRPRSPRPPSG
jgi:5-formyltetrahydrofolate cyclo-ligase